MALFMKAAERSSKKRDQLFEVDHADEVFIQELTEQIVEDAAYSLGIGNDNVDAAAKLDLQNPYFSKEARNVLKYEMNIVLRQLQRQNKLHLGHGLEKGQKSHPLTAFLKAHLFDVVREEIISPTL